MRRRRQAGPDLVPAVRHRPGLAHRPVPAVLAGVALLVTSACSEGDTPDVGVAVVERADVVEVVEAPATVAARASATLTAPADATVVEVAVTPG
ncbi:MAG: efflux transporter periplasmic adaptor subunit, partial [Actinomycetota bacterium]|nr:efflux transporter periplasmic adaptor subunit [Actinomycetota bacterium]